MTPSLPAGPAVIGRGGGAVEKHWSHFLSFFTEVEKPEQRRNTTKSKQEGKKKEKKKKQFAGRVGTIIITSSRDSFLPVKHLWELQSSHKNTSGL